MLDNFILHAREAQKKLNMQVVADCEPLVPFRQGALRGSVRYPLGIYGNVIEYDVPYARYLYGGEVYGPNIPKKDADGNIVGWWSPPNKKPTGRALTYHTEGTQDHWFEEAKARHLNEWTELVRNTLLNGADITRGGGA